VKSSFYPHFFDERSAVILSRNALRLRRLYTGGLGGLPQYCSARNVLGSAPTELARRSARFFTNATRAHRRHLRACSVERKNLH